MHHPHVLAFVGLSANMVGTLLLLNFPPDLKAYRPDGSNRGQGFGVQATPDGLRMHQRFRDGYKLALALLFLGFFLQLLDLLIATQAR
jgi:hypothetical protein